MDRPACAERPRRARRCAAARRRMSMRAQRGLASSEQSASPHAQEQGRRPGDAPVRRALQALARAPVARAPRSLLARRRAVARGGAARAQLRPQARLRRAGQVTAPARARRAREAGGICDSRLLASMPRAAGRRTPCTSSPRAAARACAGAGPPGWAPAGPPPPPPLRRRAATPPHKTPQAPPWPPAGPPRSCVAPRAPRRTPLRPRLRPAQAAPAYASAHAGLRATRCGPRTAPHPHPKRMLGLPPQTVGRARQQGGPARALTSGESSSLARGKAPMQLTARAALSSRSRGPRASANRCARRAAALIAPARTSATPRACESLYSISKPTSASVTTASASAAQAVCGLSVSSPPTAARSPGGRPPASAPDRHDIRTRRRRLQALEPGRPARPQELPPWGRAPRSTRHARARTRAPAAC